MVYDRRAADKVAPLIRWAEARIARNPRLAGGDYWPGATASRASWATRPLDATPCNTSTPSSVESYVTPSAADPDLDRRLWPRLVCR